MNERRNRQVRREMLVEVLGRLDRFFVLFASKARSGAGLALRFDLRLRLTLGCRLGVRLICGFRCFGGIGGGGATVGRNVVVWLVGDCC